MKTSNSVYSTETGRLCPDCGKPVAACICKRGKVFSGGDGIIRVSRETKGRKGKGVTLITGFRGTEEEMLALCRRLKQLCGTGGTVKNGIIEIQGDLRHKIVSELEAGGYKVKLAGG